MKYVIQTTESYGTEPLIIDDDKCDVCLVFKQCLITDSAAGEYADVKICKSCIDLHFEKANA
jgi:hypothetical protein